jgi:hypothetical protein
MYAERMIRYRNRNRGKRIRCANRRGVNPERAVAM